MKISYNWLKQYVDFDIDPAALAEILTNTGLEVEGMEEWLSVEGGLEGIVIGEVVECSKHPDADRLSVTKVNVGKPELLNIVCGAPNVAKGQKVPVATIGTNLKLGDTEITIKKSKIRGQLSEGMICAEDELGLGSSHEGILVLPDDAVPGTPGSDYFTVEKDTVYEIGLTPNRIDGASHFGVSRDIAAFLNQSEDKKATKPCVDTFRSDNTSLTIPVIVENNVDCIRYSGLTISNVKVSESPDWLKTRLRAIGLSPINNIVDITNFVLHEIGQPLHAFDADKITGAKVIVKNLPDKTRFVTLDEQERELSSRDLMICNTESGMCIAGVFGGIGSGVTATTRNIFLESACFNPVSVRKTARRHDLNTDASFRFERGSDPAITVWALKRAASLIKEIAGGKISSEVIDVYPREVKKKVVEVSFFNIKRLIGEDPGREKTERILSSLDFNIIESNDKGLKLEVPTYRVDVTREADVIEEILRIYGYNTVAIDNNVNSTLTYIDKPDKEKVINTIADMLTGSGFMEIMSNSLTQASLYDNNPDFGSSNLVTIANPLSNDLNALRQTLLYGGLSAISRNINRQNHNLRLYELGNCYKKNTEKATSVNDHHEYHNLDLFITGQQSLESWNSKTDPTDFFHLKSAVDMILDRAGINTANLDEDESSYKFFSEGLDYIMGDNVMASLGKIDSKVAASFDIKQDVYYATIGLDNIIHHIRNTKTTYTELPKYPSVRRDLALLVDSSVRFKTLKELAYKTEKKILREVGLFDVYEDASLGENKKSYALSFILRDDKRTLNDKMIDRVMNNLIRTYSKELNASIR